MWSCEHSVVADGVSADQVWAVWADLANWPAWDAGLALCRPGGPMAVGGTYVLRPKGGPEMTATFTRVDPGRGFADVTRLPLCRLAFDHDVADVPGGTGVRVTHRVTFTGPAAFLFRRAIGAGIARGLPATLAGLVGRARTVGAPVDAPPVPA